MEDESFRIGVLEAEMELGCIPLGIKGEIPPVVAMRALQYLLGSKGFNYLPRETTPLEEA